MESKPKHQNKKGKNPTKKNGRRARLTHYWDIQKGRVVRWTQNRYRDSSQTEDLRWILRWSKWSSQCVVPWVWGHFNILWLPFSLQPASFDRLFIRIAFPSLAKTGFLLTLIFLLMCWIPNFLSVSHSKHVFYVIVNHVCTCKHTTIHMDTWATMQRK